MFKYKFKMTVTATVIDRERVYTKYGNSIEEMKLTAIQIITNEPDCRHYEIKIENFKMI